VVESRYVGPPAAVDADLGTRGYITSAMATDMTVEQIDNAVTARLSSRFATRAYADTQDGLNANADFVASGDATRLKLAQKDVANGVAGLDAGGRVNRNRINRPSQQRYPRVLWTPTSYGTPVAGTTESTVYTVAVTDPGYPYRLAVFGNVDALSSFDSAAPQILVRAGSTSGPVIASGIGTNESYNYLGVDLFSRSGSTLGSGWEEQWNGSGNGHAECDGNSARYARDGSSNSRIGTFRRLGNDATTISDYQEIDWWASSDCDPGTQFGTSGRNLVCGRMSDDHSSWVGFALDANTARFAYCLGGTITLGASAGCDNTNGSYFRARIGTEAGDRYFQLLRNGTSVLSVQDSGLTTAMGSGNRGWGFGFRAGNKEFAFVSYEQAEPSRVDWITINDTLPGQDSSSIAPVYVMPDSLSTQTVRTGPVTLYVRSAASTYVMGAGYNYKPSLSVLALPA
jgi:hypothetical protein